MLKIDFNMSSNAASNANNAASNVLVDLIIVSTHLPDILSSKTKKKKLQRVKLAAIVITEPNHLEKFLKI